MTKPAPSLGNYVYQQLLQQICVDNLYAIGAKLPPEERLAKEFGVSRPVVRLPLPSCVPKASFSPARAPDPM